MQITVALWVVVFKAHESAAPLLIRRNPIRSVLDTHYTNSWEVASAGHHFVVVDNTYACWFLALVAQKTSRSKQNVVQIDWSKHGIEGLFRAGVKTASFSLNAHLSSKATELKIFLSCVRTVPESPLGPGGPGGPGGPCEATAAVSFSFWTSGALE